jgi:hypothetical protein
MNKPHLQCFLEEVLILVHLGVSPAGSGEYQGRRKCFSFLVHQEGDTLGSVLSRDLKIHIKPSHVSLVKLSISTSSTLHYHTLSPPPPSTCYLILDLCAYCSCLRATSLPSRTFFASHFPLPISLAYTYLDFSRFTPSSARSCPCPASSLSPETFTLVLPSSAPQHQTPPTQVCHVTPPTYPLFLDTTHAPYCMHTGTILTLTLIGFLNAPRQAHPRSFFFLLSSRPFILAHHTPSRSPFCFSTLAGLFACPVPPHHVRVLFWCIFIPCTTPPFRVHR